MKKIKVLVLTTSFPLTQSSVSGLFVKRLIDCFPSVIEPIVVTPCDENNNNSIEMYDYEIKCFKYAPKKLQVLAHKSGGIPAALQRSKLSLLLVPFFLIAMFVKCFIESKDVDLIHANWSICGVIAGVVGKLRSKPTITTIRGEDGNKSDTSIVFKILLKMTLYFSECVVGVSDSLVYKIKSASKNKDIKVICVPNGVEPSLAKYTQANRPDANKELILISVGNLTDNKNTALVIHAVHELIVQGKNVTLNIIGDGPKRTELKQLIDNYGISKNVYLRGALCSEKVYEFISKSNIFVLSSFREGRPNVLLESMALGTPIVASNIEGVQELISDGISGLLYNPNSCEQLIKCINKIAEDVQLQKKLSANAQNYIKSNKLFWDESAKKYHDLYVSVL